MADKIILLDNSILLNYFIKTEKFNSICVKLSDRKLLNKKHFDRIEGLQIIENEIK